MTVAIIGTLDTKGREFEYVRQLLTALHLQTTVIDAGSLGTPEFTADVGREAVNETPPVLRILLGDDELCRPQGDEVFQRSIETLAR